MRNVFWLMVLGMVFLGVLPVWANFMPVAVNGNIGVGSTVPTQKLDVVGTVKATSFSGDGSGLANVAGTISGLNSGRIPYATGANALVDSQIYVLGNGNVGVGSVAPTVKLDVKGDVNLNNNIKISTSGGEITINLQENPWVYLQVEG
ncbi:MAG: hypothetical protein V2A70_10735 [Candidatus Omnitrophota bacterium]